MSVTNLSRLSPKFVDFHPNIEMDEDQYDFSVPELSSDSGGMDKGISDNFTEISSSLKSQNKKIKRSYHWATKNKSFLELHEDLKKLGIINNKFFLTLYDRGLENIDPYSIILPLEIQARIIKECIINPWYWLRELCRIPVDGRPICPGGGVPFRIDRNSAATWYLFLYGIDHYSSKPRQRGKTQDAIAKINYAYHFGAVSATMSFGNKDSTVNKMNLARFKTQRDLLPAWMQMKTCMDFETLKLTKEVCNMLSMKNPINKNTIILLPNASTQAKADGIGRGFTTSIQLWDEFDWMDWNTTIINASVFAYNTASENARKNHSLYGRIFTSTPGNLDSKCGKSAETYINGNKDEVAMLRWNDKMFDTPIEQLKSTVGSKNYRSIVYVEHSWKQLKCSMEWYEKACNDVGYNPEQIAREICLVRLKGAGRSPFTRNKIIELNRAVEEPISKIPVLNLMEPIFVYEELNRSIPYLIGMDTAEGVGGDNIAMVLINPYTEKIAAEFASPNITQTNMGKFLDGFLMKYCPKAVIVIENNRGRELIHFIENTRFCEQLWYDMDRIGDKELVGDKDLTIADRALGFNTSTKTRPLVFGIITTLVNEEMEKVNTRLVVNDICNLERNIHGKIAAVPGEHDDVLMAWGIAQTVFRLSTNLENWGIYRGMTRPQDTIKPDTKELMKVKFEEIKTKVSKLPDDIQQLFQIDKSRESDVAEYLTALDQAKMVKIIDDEAHMSDDEREATDLAMRDPQYDDLLTKSILDLNYVHTRDQRSFEDLL